jgi:hypothetical protein
MLFLWIEKYKHGNDEEFEIIFARETDNRLWHKNEKINCEVIVSLVFLLS